jgi:hypothetical protein
MPKDEIIIPLILVGSSAALICLYDALNKSALKTETAASKPVPAAPAMPEQQKIKLFEAAKGYNGDNPKFELNRYIQKSVHAIKKIDELGLEPEYHRYLTNAV